MPTRWAAWRPRFWRILWRMIPAVAAGRAYKVDPVTWMQFSGLASAHRVLDDVERTLLNPP